VNFGVRVRTWDTLPEPNFVRIAQGDLSIMEKFLGSYQKFEIFTIFS